MALTQTERQKMAKMQRHAMTIDRAASRIIQFDRLDPIDLAMAQEAAAQLLSEIHNESFTSIVIQSEQASQVLRAISLMRSMIACGEKETQTSTKEINHAIVIIKGN